MAEPQSTQRLSFHGLPGCRSCGALSKSEIALMVGDQASVAKLHEAAKEERPGPGLLQQNKLMTDWEDSTSPRQTV